MSQAVNVNFKLDADVKKSMEQACADMGLTMSAAFTVFAKKSAEKDVYRLKLPQTRFTLKAIWHTCAVVSPPLMPEKVLSMNPLRLMANEKNMV